MTKEERRVDPQKLANLISSSLDFSHDFAFRLRFDSEMDVDDEYAQHQIRSMIDHADRHNIPVNVRDADADTQRALVFMGERWAWEETANATG